MTPLLKDMHSGVPDEQVAIDFYLRTKKTGLTYDTIQRFRNIIYSYYKQHARNALPWRKTHDPYCILVSEIMLQQTQVDRVLKKYPVLINKYPDVQSLARAPLRSLYAVWQGMGYNRRALALKQFAAAITKAPYHGTIPHSVEELIGLPGVGQATAGAVAAFAFNKPVPFIETNIRRVFIHFFFRDETSVTDKEIAPLVEKTLHKKDPRTWYYALMDYGSALRRLRKNPNLKSSGYSRQKPFAGSNRQMRGRILRLFMKHQAMSGNEIIRTLSAPPDRVIQNLTRLKEEGFIKKKGNLFRMA
jgi:A/G-specific adenine glycosylase